MKTLLLTTATLTVLNLHLASAADYPLRPTPFTDVKIEDAFWTPRFETNRQRTVWYDYQKCEETGRIENFDKAAGKVSGAFRGEPYDDSDVFKVIEGAAYIIALQPDPKLEEYTDALIEKIAAAQEPDGYLYTARTIDPAKAPGRASKERWLNELGGLNGSDSHELYNAGHMYEAAVAYYQATGKRRLLDVAIKHADLVAKVWGHGPDQLKIPTGHQEIEIGLVRLYRVTGDRKYLDLSHFLLECRGRNFDQVKRKANPYYADHLPVTEQTEAVGHAVRSAYMYSSMADIAALTGDRAYSNAVAAIWQNVVGRKLHITGGIGAVPHGEAFGNDYDLPNATAYNETCAAIANALWNHRMFLLEGDAKYIDVLERTIYNGFLSGVSMSGDRFFYPNPLESDGKRRFNHGHSERAPWFGTSCCPVNDVRFVPSIAGYIYASRGKDLYVNLFIGGSSTVDLQGAPVKLQQQTRYPWDGATEIRVDPGQSREFTLHVRIPGWARNQPVPSDLYRYDDSLTPGVKLTVNGKPVALTVEKGFARITRSWKSGDTVTLALDMPVRRVVSHPAVAANRDRFAIERGPLVYCFEGADNGGKVLNTFFPGKVTFSSKFEPQLLGGVTTITATAENGTKLKAIPYYAWCHRGPNEMRVWHPVREPLQMASHCWETDSVEACFDQRVPSASNDESIPRFTWWDHRGTLEWVMRRFDEPRRVSGVEVYWFDDTGKGECRVPQSWRVLYRDGGEWKPVTGPSEYGVERDRFNRVSFDPVTTDAVRLQVQLRPEVSGGILEWKVNP